MNIFQRILAVGTAFIAASTGLASAAEVVRTERTTTTILAEKAGFAPGETLWFAVRQEIRDGWHVFWINPGDAGLPLAMEWDLPDGFEVGDILHPVPEKIPVGPLASFAHLGEPVFLVPVKAPRDVNIADVIDVSIRASWQACEDICVPEQGAFSFSMPVVEAAAVNGQNRDVFQRARAALPGKIAQKALLSKEGDLYALKLNWNEESAPADAFFFPEQEGLTEPAADQTVTLKNGELTILMTPGYASPRKGDEVAGLLAFRAAAGSRAGFELSAAADPSVTQTSALSPVQSVSGGIGAPMLLALAFFGGLILNVMPCVFPIVFVKAASLMQSAHGDQATVRRHGLLYTAGVVAMFVFIGGALLALRAGGEQLGWGFHLQSPVVVALSAYVLFLVGLNLAGLFHVGTSLQGAGAGFAAKKGVAGSIFTGALAVVVAAPCIGPLLSAPMGAALMQPALIGMLIFMVMALGLAAPYLALTFAPRLGRLLPKPGPWMATFKQLLAFPVFAAAAYFVWVFSRQTGESGLGFVLGGAVLLAFAAWLFEKSKGEGAPALLARAAAGVATVLALAPLFRVDALAANPAPVERFGALTAEPFDDAAITRHLESGQPVFVDFTASWCVTCQFDRLTIFSRDDVRSAFDREKAVFMVADWTVRDPEITAALERFGASGVPFYVYYPVDGAPEILSLPISKNSILETLSR